MSNHYREPLEDQIKDLAYPATLPASVRRLLVVKLHRIGNDYNERVHVIQNHQQSALRARPVSELSTDVANLARRLYDAKQEVRRLEKMAEPHQIESVFLQNDEVHVYFKITEETRQEEVKMREKALAEARVERDHQLKELKQLIIDLANHNLGEVRSKIPKELLARIDAIETPALLYSDADLDT